MNFSDAIPLAKSNPGSVIKRSGDYGFIVVSDSGKVISDADIDPSMYAKRLEQDNHRLKQELDTCTSTIDKLKKLADEHEAEASKLKDKLKKVVGQRRADKSAWNLRRSRLEAELNRVSPKDWRQKISARETADLYAEKKAYRSTQNCSCGGLQEKCHYCSGMGSYVVDGFGNRVSGLRKIDFRSLLLGKHASFSF